MPATDGTISEYDIILSISQDAINKQFHLLYDHKLSTDEIHTAHPVAGGAAAAPAQYAINHDWNIQTDTFRDSKTGKDRVSLKTGIFGHIECPQANLTTGDPDQVQISVTFKSDPSVVDSYDSQTGKRTTQDSRIFYWTGDPDEGMTLDSTVINGWKLSWICNVRQQIIKDSLPRLIEKHRDPNDPTYLLPGLLDSFQTVDSALFTISSIFCLFEEAQFVETFSLVDENGVEPIDTVSTNSAKGVSRYFAGLAKAEKVGNVGGAGIYNPDNPFVLGYSISQDIQKIQNVQPDATWQQTPAFFIPYRFDITTTTGTNATANTLNYCMLTHNSKDPSQDHPRNIDPMQTRDAGNLSQSMFDITKSSFDDGIMAWSKNIFWNKWIVETIRPAFWQDPVPVIQNFMKSRGVDSWEFDWQRPTIVDDANGATWIHSIEFQTKTVGQDGGPLFNTEMSVNGYSRTSLTVTSDYTNNGQNQLAPDHARKAYIEATMEFKLYADWEIFTKGPADARRRAYQGGATYRYKFNLVIEASQAGTWHVSYMNSDSERPSISTTTLSSGLGHSQYIEFQDIGDSLAPEQGYGAWVENHEYLSAVVFSPGNVQNQLRNAAQISTLSSLVDLENKLAVVASQLKTSVMMPGGQVFTFNGMDTDHQGQLYAHLNFGLGATN